MSPLSSFSPTLPARQVLDALTHLPHCIDYMRGLTHPLVFRFCAIPQIMAAGTLALCYNNGSVFEGVVKMRRGQTALIFSSCDDMGALLAWFNQFLAVLADKASSQVARDDPTLPQLRALLASHQARCSRELTEVRLGVHACSPGCMAGGCCFVEACASIPGNCQQKIGSSSECARICKGCLQVRVLVSSVLR